MLRPFPPPPTPRLTEHLAHVVASLPSLGFCSATWWHLFQSLERLQPPLSNAEIRYLEAIATRWPDQEREPPETWPWRSLFEPPTHDETEPWEEIQDTLQRRSTRRLSERLPPFPLQPPSLSPNQRRLLPLCRSLSLPSDSTADLLGLCTSPLFPQITHFRMDSPLNEWSYPALKPERLVQVLLSSPWRLRSLLLRESLLSPSTLQSILRSEAFGDLTTLIFLRCSLSKALFSWWNQADLLPPLQELQFLCCTFEQAELSRFLASASLTHLERLCIHADETDHPLASSDLAALLQNPSLSSLRHLELPHNQIDDEGFLALLASPLATRLDTLDLSVNPLTEPSIRALLSSSSFRSLRTLRLSSIGLSASLASDFLAASSFPFLRELDVSLAESVSPLSSLASNPFLPNLHTFRADILSEETPAPWEDRLTFSPFLPSLRSLQLYFFGGYIALDQDTPDTPLQKRHAIASAPLSEQSSCLRDPTREPWLQTTVLTAWQTQTFPTSEASLSVQLSLSCLFANLNPHLNDPSLLLESSDAFALFLSALRFLRSTPLDFLSNDLLPVVQTLASSGPPLLSLEANDLLDLHRRHARTLADLEEPLFSSS